MVDVGAVSELHGIVLDDEPHRLDFYDLLLVTRGQGWIELDGDPVPLRPHQLVVTSPGQVRRLHLAPEQRPRFEGLVLFFLGPFALDFFNDPFFLHRLHFFHQHRGATALALEAQRAAWFGERLLTMRRELRDFRADSEHLLRAVLYELLVCTNRWFAEAAEVPSEALVDVRLLRLLRLLEQPDARRDVNWHARQLGISTTHLRSLTRRALGTSPGALVRASLTGEAKRRLLFSAAPVGAVAASLGFDDPAYFSRFFRREAGVAPTEFRGLPQPAWRPPVAAGEPVRLASGS
ncbi:MAG: helix-turn-helix domain-containing protein [Acidobacteria bacterium]|nr:MAG: helix-turn-helix domain-containing protein [Acidobacteriota bacterium]